MRQNRSTATQTIPPERSSDASQLSLLSQGSSWDPDQVRAGRAPVIIAPLQRQGHSRGASLLGEDENAAVAQQIEYGLPPRVDHQRRLQRPPLDATGRRCCSGPFWQHCVIF